MPRPSQAVDQALLQSGLALYPQVGCAGLSLRKVAEHAGTQPAMVHYHFGSKQAFLGAVLQQCYEQLFAQMSERSAADGAAGQRLRTALLALAGFLREHRALIARLLMDAAQGEPVVHSFLQANAPRHLGLVMRLLGEVALKPGVLPMQAFAFLMGSVNAPLLVASGALHIGVVPGVLGEQLAAQVVSDAALAQRVDLALAALCATEEGSPDDKV